MNEPLSCVVERTVRHYRMLRPGAAVVVGFSGGADSVALLSWLFQNAGPYGIPVAAAHLHHGLRGAEADRDAAFARAFCEARGIPFFERRVDTAALARAAGEGVEACGRRLRYAFFADVCKQYPDALIATAHTLSDNAETMLLRLARGAGAKGLSGIPFVRGRIIRPLRAVTREQVEAYCREQGLSFCEDSTNADLRFARNRVRRCIVPQMKRLDPRFEEAAGRAAKAFSEDEACLWELGEEALQAARFQHGFSCKTLLLAKRAVRMRALQKAAGENGAAPLSQGHLDALDAILSAGGSCVLPGAVRASVSQGVLLFLKAPDGFSAPSFQVPLAFPETPLPDGRTLFLRPLSAKSQEKPDFPFSNAIDYDTITPDTVVRTRRPGDRFCQPGRREKPLRRLQNDLRIPAALRDGLLVLADRDGLLWAQGCGVSARAACSRKTRRIAVIEVKECTENWKT